MAENTEAEFLKYELYKRFSLSIFSTVITFTIDLWTTDCKKILACIHEIVLNTPHFHSPTKVY